MISRILSDAKRGRKGLPRPPQGSLRCPPGASYRQSAIPQTDRPKRQPIVLYISYIELEGKGLGLEGRRRTEEEKMHRNVNQIEGLYDCSNVSNKRLDFH